MGRFSSSLPLLRASWKPAPSSWVCRSCSRQLSSQPSPKTKPWYITTPIFYVNADPHVGHLYSMVLADVLKRFQTLQGRTALLSTGVDEHGLKVQKAAQAAGLTPQELCDREAKTFKSLADRANISYDKFVRTTSLQHKHAVEYAWKHLLNHGYIYETKHEGWYCVSDETFYPDSSVVEKVDSATGRKQMVSTETGKAVEWASETNYKFSLSEFRDRLLAFYTANPTWIEPKQRMNLVIREVESGLRDLSVSRPSERVQWGIPVPEDPSQTIYVWLDALLNYAVQAGYPFAPSKGAEGGWPADVQVIGKDIIRFHCIYWPAFLMALKLPIPPKYLCHAHWTMDQEKMSKSVGNVVNPFEAMDMYGHDAIRFYMMYDGGILDDADYSNAGIIHRYGHLKNILGNFLSRLTRAKKWSVQMEVAKTFEMGAQKEVHTPGYAMLKLFDAISSISGEVEQAIQQANPRKAAQAIEKLISLGNASFAQFAPWEYGIPGDPAAFPDKGREAIYLCSESLRVAGILLQPFMPDKANQLLNTLGVKPERRTWEYATIGADDAYGQIFWHKSAEGLLFPPLAQAT